MDLMSPGLKTMRHYPDTRVESRHLGGLEEHFGDMYNVVNIL
jgi:hypothetical protein